MQSTRPELTATLLLLLALAAPGATAQPSAAEPTAVAVDSATELARIRAALERIADALVRQNEAQRAELAMRRLDMESRAAGRLEGEISDLVSSRDSVADERFRMQAQLLAFAEQTEGADGTYSVQEVSRLREQFDLQIGLLEARIAGFDRRLEELRNQLAGHRESARGWQALIDRHLQGDRGP